MKKAIDKRTTKEYSERQSELMTGNHNASKRKVVQKDATTGREIEKFLSVKAASEKTGISHGNIRANLDGRTKTAGGYKWEDFKDDLIKY